MPKAGTYKRKTKSVPKLLIPAPNWKQLLFSLMRAGYRRAEIARVLNADPAVITRLLQGLQDPKYSVGEGILLLHKDLIEKERNHSNACA